MHELRKDILLGRWVAVLSESMAPSEYNLSPNTLQDDKNCILCPGREGETPSEIMSIREPDTRPNTPGWWVKAIPSFDPVFQSGGDLGEKALVSMTK